MNRWITFSKDSSSNSKSCHSEKLSFGKNLSSIDKSTSKILLILKARGLNLYCWASWPSLLFTWTFICIHMLANSWNALSNIWHTNTQQYHRTIPHGKSNVFNLIIERNITLKEVWSILCASTTECATRARIFWLRVVLSCKTDPYHHFISIWSKRIMNSIRNYIKWEERNKSTRIEQQMNLTATSKENQQWKHSWDKKSTCKGIPVFQYWHHLKWKSAFPANLFPVP